MSGPCEKDNLHSFEGIITPAEWDDQHRVTSYSLWTVEEEEYRLVFPWRLDYQEVEQYFQEEVTVIGKAGFDSKGKQTLAVARLKRRRRK